MKAWPVVPEIALDALHAPVDNATEIPLEDVPKPPPLMVIGVPGAAGRLLVLEIMPGTRKQPAVFCQR